MVVKYTVITTLNFHNTTRPKIQFSKKYQLATLNKIDFGMLLTHRYFAQKVEDLKNVL